jgi:RNA-directed DNA polymerase
MRERLAEFSLSLHPEKTRLIEFGRQAVTKRKQRGLGKPEAFKFLGFVLICGTSRRGRFLLKRKSRGDRMRAKLKEIKGKRAFYRTGCARGWPGRRVTPGPPSGIIGTA